MGHNEINKYEFELLGHTDLMIDMIHNRIVLTTDTQEDYDNAYRALCESVNHGMFYLRHVSEGVDHVYFSKTEDRAIFINAIQNI